MNLEDFNTILAKKGAKPIRLSKTTGDPIPSTDQGILDLWVFSQRLSKIRARKRR